MGHLLSHPIEDKNLDYKTYTRLSYCIGSMQGYRMSMEDAHDAKINEDETIAVFGVFDGHGGQQCAEYLSHHLTKHIFRRLINLQETKKSKRDYGNKQIIKILKDSFFKMDNDLSDSQSYVNCGSTSVVTAVIDNKIFVANTGDSRCILSTNEGNAKTLSFDQKPSVIGERVRIENSNGYVINNRVNEILALSRAVGDFKFKTPYLTSTLNRYILDNITEKYKKGQQEQQKSQPNRRSSSDSSNSSSNNNKSHLNNNNSNLSSLQISDHEYIHIPPELFQVTVEPEILIFDMNELPTPEFIVIACDGIWDCFRNDQLIKLIRDKLVLGWKLNKVVEYILNDSLTMANNYTGIGLDNMTLIIVALHPGKSLEEWYSDMIFKIEREKGLH
ncbi:Ptc4 Type PP2C serine/threonine phosphatase [Candida orthopsilosis Co 90-125]|uniref:protein-serine/threonine phosphatase n=1 Tax=Candida orthopsilosis (strain 90-125) TaxID=1136231 RepID=H8X6D9_CANO9|nr:Ptc4 Type PP2C serine/threonine phosphatase [Candida orthopsilosis Co 90-125]CCG23387.1 Ptc4 Type PP2C serine/threonine phosphatase [Candida orthopsilosis Co 90-125]